MTIIGGPHDGAFALKPQPGQIGMVASASPARHSAEPGEVGAYYQPIRGRWVFQWFVSREADESEWRALFWGIEVVK